MMTHPAPQISDSAQMLLLALQRTLSTLELALRHRPEPAATNGAAIAPSGTMNGISVLPETVAPNALLSEQAYWETISQLVRTVEGLLDLLEREGHPERLELSCEDTQTLIAALVQRTQETMATQHATQPPAG